MTANYPMVRRDFLKAGAAVAAGLTLAPAGAARAAADPERPSALAASAWEDAARACSTFCLP